MNLEFIKEGTKWVAEFEATGEFNLHLEKEEGEVNVFQTTVLGGKPDVTPSLHLGYKDKVMDSDVTALVWPKYIRVEAFTEDAPTAVVTFKS